MNIPLDLRAWVSWKLSSQDGRSQCFSETALIEDASYDFEKKGDIKSLPKMLREMVADGTLRRVDGGFLLADRERYTDVHVPTPPPLVESETCKALRARLVKSAHEAWKSSPEKFWITTDDGEIRLGTPLDVGLGRKPDTLKKMPKP